MVTVGLTCAPAESWLVWGGFLRCGASGGGGCWVSLVWWLVGAVFGIWRGDRATRMGNGMVYVNPTLYMVLASGAETVIEAASSNVGGGQEDRT